jgi:hypothetical protein
VTFNEHMSPRDVAGMTSGIAAYGNVFSGSSNRQSIVEIFRASKAPHLKAQLTKWEQYGFLSWVEDNSN